MLVPRKVDLCARPGGRSPPPLCLTLRTGHGLGAGARREDAERGKIEPILTPGDSRLRSRSSRKQHEHGGQKLTRLVPSGTLILIGFLVIGLYVGGEAGFVDLNPVFPGG